MHCRGAWSVVTSNPPPRPPIGATILCLLSCLARVCQVHWLLLVSVTFEWMWHTAIPDWKMRPTRREGKRSRRETQGLTVPPVHPFSFGQTYCCCSQLLFCFLGGFFCIFSLRQQCDSVSSITVYFLLLLSSFSLDFICCLATTAFYLFIGFYPTVILFPFIPTSSHFHNSLHPPHQLLMKGCGQWGKVKRRIKDTCRRNGWEDVGAKGRKR